MNISDEAKAWNRNYHGSIDTTALLLAFDAGRRSDALSSTPEASDDERPCDECGEPAWKCSPAPEIEPTEHNGGDRFTVTLNRAQWHRVDEALAAHGRNDAVWSQIAATKTAAHPTPPEDVAARLAADLEAMGIMPSTVGGQRLIATCQAALSAALAAVPADGETEKVTTLEALLALPNGTVVHSSAGTIACRLDEVDGIVFGDNRSFRWNRLALPVRILYRPIPESEEQ